MSETIRHRVLIIGMKHHLKDLYQVCWNVVSGAKRGHTFYIALCLPGGKGLRTFVYD